MLVEGVRAIALSGGLWPFSFLPPTPFSTTLVACAASDSESLSLLVLMTGSLVCLCHCGVAHPPSQLTSALTDHGPAPQEETPFVLLPDPINNAHLAYISIIQVAIA